MNFGGHIVVAVGYDDKHVYLYDNEFEVVQSITREDLAKARSSKCPPLSPKHKSYVLRKIDHVNSIMDASNKALLKSYEFMGNPPVRFLGIPGIGKLKREIARWDQIGGQTLGYLPASGRLIW